MRNQNVCQRNMFVWFSSSVCTISPSLCSSCSYFRYFCQDNWVFLSFRSNEKRKEKRSWHCLFRNRFPCSLSSFGRAKRETRQKKRCNVTTFVRSESMKCWYDTLQKVWHESKSMTANEHVHIKCEIWKCKVSSTFCCWYSFLNEISWNIYSICILTR